MPITEILSTSALSKVSCPGVHTWADLPPAMSLQFPFSVSCMYQRVPTLKEESDFACGPPHSQPVPSLLHNEPGLLSVCSFGFICSLLFSSNRKRLHEYTNLKRLANSIQCLLILACFPFGGHLLSVVTHSLIHSFPS